MSRIFPFSIFLLPFINFSPVSSSNISFSMIGFILCFLILIKQKKLYISQTSLLFFVFILFLTFSQILSSDSITNKYFSQIINMILILICFITFNSLATNYGKFEIYEYYFRYGIILCLITFCFFSVIFLLKTDSGLYFIKLFNNSGNFTGTGVALHSGQLFSEVRMNLFFPEPSFFSIYISTLIGIGIALKKQKKIIFMLIVFLLLTVGRTGILALSMIFLTLLFIKLFNPNRLIRGFIGVSLLIFPIFLYLLIFNYLTNIDMSFFQRIDSIRNAISFASESIIYGHGFETYNNMARSIGYHSGDIFNFFLSLLVVGGLLSLMPFVIFIFFVFFNSSKEELPLLCSILAILSTIPSLNIYFLIFIMAASSSSSLFKEL